MVTPLEERLTQVDEYGYPSHNLKGELLKSGDEVKLYLMADITDNVYYAWENKEDVPFWMAFSLDGETLFTVDLMKYLEEY